MRTSAFFGAKTFKFFEIYVVSARTSGEGGLSSEVRHFADKGQFFAILRGRLYERPPSAMLPEDEISIVFSSTRFLRFSWPLPVLPAVNCPERCRQLAAASPSKIFLAKWFDLGQIWFNQSEIWAKVVRFRQI